MKAKEYKTVAGDTFELIAYKTLGSCRYVSDIINANRDYIQTVIFDAGVEIEIPEKSSTTILEHLPPWRKS